jgi:dihydropteroate synthase
VIEAIKKNFSIPVSLDTYKYQVARAGISVGADLINDIWGLRIDEGQMGRVIAEAGVPCVLMHYGPLEGFFNVIDHTLQIADSCGINQDKIILDPGIGFGKTVEENLIVMKRLPSLSRYNLPVLLGTSRKSMIGHVLELPTTERLEGTIATTVMGRMAGISIFRVHDVLSNYRALKMTDAILEASC